MTENITVVDTETTGNTDEDRAVEIAGVVVRPGAARPHAWHSSLVSPGDRAVSPEARAAHHIPDSALVGAPPLEEVMRAARTVYPENGLYAAHNAAFDRQYIPQPWQQSRWICTWRCAMHIWPDAPRYSNQVLRYWLGLDVTGMPGDAGATPHRALYDAWVTAAILREMLRERTPEDLLALTTQPVLLRRVRFGKHEGQLWEDVPSGYLRWILGQGDFDADVVHTARHHLGLPAEGAA